MLGIQRTYIGLYHGIGLKDTTQMILTPYFLPNYLGTCIWLISVISYSTSTIVSIVEL